MYEFEIDYVVDTGNLGFPYIGSGVHLNKDVTFSMGLIDPQGKAVTNDYELINNPLINKVSYDIIDSSGNVVYPNFKSGTTSRSITVTAQENEKIFGTYVKDFGIQTTVTNNVNSNIFQSKFYAYGNVPTISGLYFMDGKAPSIGYSEDLPIFSGQRIDEIEVNIELSGNPLYIKLERYDIYYSDVSFDEIELPTTESDLNNHNPYYLYSHPIINEEDSKIVKISPVGLEYFVDYYFALVPYSNIGSGRAVYFGPARFVTEVSGVAPLIVTANDLNIINGSETGNISLITGLLTGLGSTVIDIIPSGDGNLVMYDFQAKTFDADMLPDPANVYQHTQLKVVLDQAGGTGAIIYEEPIYSPHLVFSITPGATNVLSVYNFYSGGSFKALRTII